MLAGRNDALASLGIASGFLASSPLLTQYSLAIPLLVSSALGAGYLTYRQLASWMDKTDTLSREGFVLPSDPVFKECMGKRGLRLGLTKDLHKPVDIHDDALVRHLAIVGQSGVGKTTMGEYLLWQQMVRGGGWIFIDAKLDKETRDKLAWMAKLMGREDDFYVLNVNEPELSNSYNPILQGDADEIASRLLNLIPSTENNPGADYYRQTANHALTVIVAALKAANYRYHFGDLSILLQSDAALRQLERMVPESAERRSLQIFLDQFRQRSKNVVYIDIKRLKEVLGGMAGRISLFAQGKFGQVFNTYLPEISLTDIIMGNKFLYVMLPTMGKDTAALNLGKMILSDLRSAVANIQALPKRERPNPAFMVFADEMGSYVMPGIARLFEQARSANISLVPSFQSFANLSTVAPDFADMIIQNNWSKVFFKFGSKDSSETAAEIIGKQVRYMRTVNVSQSESNSAQVLGTAPRASEGDSSGAAESWRENETYRATPDQLKSLSVGEAVVMSGARMFHITTPMLQFHNRIPPYQTIYHRVALNKGERTLGFEDRYKEFIQSAPSNESRLPSTEKEIE